MTTLRATVWQSFDFLSPLSLPLLQSTGCFLFSAQSVVSGAVRLFTPHIVTFQSREAEVWQTLCRADYHTHRLLRSRLLFACHIDICIGGKITLTQLRVPAVSTGAGRRGYDSPEREGVKKINRQRRKKKSGVRIKRREASTQYSVSMCCF